MRLTGAITLLVLFGAAVASWGAERNSAAEKLLMNTLAADHGSGVMAAVVIDGKLLWDGVAGSANLEERIALRHDHRLRVGSIAKPITAAMALKLVDQGRLELDVPIQTYVPDFPRKQKPITVRQLATHTSGIRQYDFSKFEEANNVRYLPNLEAGIKAWRDDPLVAEPGTKYHYSSLGYNLLGLVIEKAASASYPDALQTLIAKPLGLSGTGVNDSLKIIPNRGCFYTVTAKNPVFPWMKDAELINTIFRDDSDCYPSGGVISSARDLAKFIHAIFATDFLSPESRALLTKPARLNDGSAAVSGAGGNGTLQTFGFYELLNTEGEVFGYGHNGLTNGGYGLVRYYPGRRMAVAAAANYNHMGDKKFFSFLGDDLPALFGAKE